MVQSDRVRHNWSDFVHTHIHTHTSQNQELPEVASVFPILSITKLRLRPILLYEIRKCAWCDSIYSNYDFKNAYFSQMPYSYFSIHTCEIRKTKFHSAFVSQRESTLHLFWRESTLHSDWEIQQRLKLSSIPGSGRSPQEGNGNPLHFLFIYFFPLHFLNTNQRALSVT